tara:strand:+ start:614 stop:811 length:198 start_codon:yes stop_codon:yes gene_type:complete
MSDKEFDNLETEVKKLLKLSKQLKESNEYLLKKNSDLAVREQHLASTLNFSKKRILKLIDKLKNK